MFLNDNNFDQKYIWVFVSDKNVCFFARTTVVLTALSFSSCLFGTVPQKYYYRIMNTRTVIIFLGEKWDGCSCGFKLSRLVLKIIKACSLAREKLFGDKQKKSWRKLHVSLSNSHSLWRCDDEFFFLSWRNTIFLLWTWPR